ncbi:hypothetical protein SM033_00250 [Vibrio phage vB_VpaM_sm033]|nr:hypothetical protein SM033_00250 [Vibrio phage vB_VpaM_sm033]
MSNTSFTEMNRRIFVDRVIKIKANPVILAAIRENSKVVITEDLIDGQQGVDWQGNQLTVEDASTPLIEAIFNRNPLNYGNEEDYEYSTTSLQSYSLTCDEVVEVFHLTGGLIITGKESLQQVYDMIRKYRAMLLEKLAWDVHGSSDPDITEDLEKMGELIDWLRPVCRQMQGKWHGEGILSRLFANAATVVGVNGQVDDDDIVITKKMPYRHATPLKDPSNTTLGTLEDWIK